MQKQLPIIYSMCTVELSGNLRKQIEVMPVTIYGPNIQLGFFAGSVIKQKSQPENMLFPSVFSLHLLVQQSRIFISDASSCVTGTSFSVKPTSSLLTETIKVADFQTENIKGFACMPFNLSMQIRILGLIFSVLVTLDVNSNTNHVCVAPTK